MRKFFSSLLSNTPILMVCSITSMEVIEQLPCLFGGSPVSFLLRLVFWQWINRDNELISLLLSSMWWSHIRTLYLVISSLKRLVSRYLIVKKKKSNHLIQEPCLYILVFVMFLWFCLFVLQTYTWGFQLLFSSLTPESFIRILFEFITKF